MNTKRKTFKPFEQVLYRDAPHYIWLPGFFFMQEIQPKTELEIFVLFDGIKIYNPNDIKPYDGNEFYAYTKTEPEMEFELEEGTPVMAYTKNCNWVLAKYRGEDDFTIGRMNVIFTNGQCIEPRMIVPFGNFDPNDIDASVRNAALVMDDGGKLRRLKKGGES